MAIGKVRSWSGPVATILVAAMSTLIAGCGDPGYTFWLRNDSQSRVIVRFTDQAGDYALDPGDAGRGPSSLGVARGRIEILDADCVRTRSIDITTQLGLVTIDMAGTASFTEVGPDSDDVRGLDRELLTDSVCEGAVQEPPLPSGDEAALGAGAIAFTGGPRGGLFVVGTDGSGIRPLTDADEGQTQATAWSPDGQRIAIVRFVSGFAVELVVLDVNTRQETLVRPGGWSPTWSPTGDELAFVDGGELETGGPVVAMDLAAGTLRDLGVDGTDPSWSPDGAWLAYHVLGDGYIGDSTIWLVPAGGGDRREMTRPDLLGLGIAWSPDGAAIATTVGPPDASSVAILPVDGGEARVLGIDALSIAGPAWSPDGSTIAIVGWEANASFADEASIYAIPADGGSSMRLTMPGEFESDSFVSWSPMGDRIAFLRADIFAAEYADLWIARPDGSGAFLVAEGASWPAWQPGG